MRHSSLVLSISVALPFLAGCSWNNATPSRGLASAGWLSPTVRKGTSGPLLYVADQSDNQILIYPESGYNQSPVGKITSGISSPYGLNVDQSGNLYVANQGTKSVTVYAPGSTDPSAKYTEDLTRPLYPLVDASGDLFVSNASTGKCETATVVEYESGSTKPYRELSVPGHEADGMDFDQQGNLYVVYRRACGRGHPGGIERFAPGSSQGEDLGIEVHQPQALIVDKNDNLILTDTGDRDSVVFFQAGKRYKKFRVKLPADTPVEIAITSDETQLFVSCLSGKVYETGYPLTASSTWTEYDEDYVTLQGIALSNGQTF